jgi:hypothetical protein
VNLIHAQIRWRLCAKDGAEKHDRMELRPGLRIETPSIVI